MRSRTFVAIGGAVVAGAVGCASILSIPDRSPDWCNQPANKHDFCDDFDHFDAGGAWGAGSAPGASIDFVPSTDSPPNALDLTTTAMPFGSSTLAGLFQEFPDQTFDRVRLAADVMFVKVDLGTQAGLAAELGFFLIEEPNFCLGAVLTPAGIGIVMRAHTTDCTSVRNVPVEAGAIMDDAGLTAYAPVGPMPTLNQWFHVTLDVKRNSDGSGAVAFGINYPGVITAPQIPRGFLTAAPPAVAVATSVTGPAGRIELEFDNVTVDFSPN
jgi:hypothetical protein